MFSQCDDAACAWQQHSENVSGQPGGLNPRDLWSMVRSRLDVGHDREMRLSVNLGELELLLAQTPSRSSVRRRVSPCLKCSERSLSLFVPTLYPIQMPEHSV